ncbi:MAG: hypothetical protein ACI4F7_00855 [Acutalibacteraceae bacterium]
MIFLPKAFERYLSALRLYVQMSVLKKGGGAKQLAQLKTISLAEAFYFKNERCPVDIIKLTNSLMGAAVIILLQREIRLSLKLLGGGVYLVNRRLFSALLSELAAKAENGCEISVSVQSNAVIIKAAQLERSDVLPRLIKAMNGFFLYERVKNTLLIFIPCEKTRLPSQKIENEWCYILDRFSPVNIWLLNQRNDPP